MTISRPLAVVGVFTNQVDAERAIRELQSAGFQDDQIGVAARRTTDPTSTEVRDLSHKPDATYLVEGAATGVAAGAGLGALAGLAILAGVLPPIGPAIVGGTLAVVLSTAAAGAAAVGLAGALAGLGVSHDEAQRYEKEFHAGRVIVAVTPNDRYEDARAVIERCGGFELSNRVSPTEPHTIPIAMPMEPGVPVPFNLAGEAIEPRDVKPVEVPVRSEQLVGDGGIPTSRSTVRVPVGERDLESHNPQPHSR